MVDTEAPKVDPELTQEENQKRFALYYARKDKRPHEGSRKSSWVYKSTTRLRSSLVVNTGTRKAS